jgi:hypothetical protein
MVSENHPKTGLPAVPISTPTSFVIPSTRAGATRRSSEGSHCFSLHQQRILYVYSYIFKIMPKPAPSKARRNTKRTGELAEAAFLLKAESLGLRVSKPWGDSERYDFLLDSAGRLWRVQVKCTESANAGGYQVQSTYCDKRRKGKYTAADVDFLVAYIIPLDLWYIVPVAAFPASASLRFYPEGGCRRPRFEQFREAWHLFRSSSLAHPSTSASSELSELEEDENPCAEALQETTSVNAAESSPLLNRMLEIKRIAEKRMLAYNPDSKRSHR